MFLEIVVVLHRTATGILL